jgi:hypothetical protein
MPYSLDTPLPDRSLWRDEHGAILVPAIVMGALLVGALFYVAAIGDAIMFRTQLQDAADATAFKAAVWHARGMNAVVVLNVLMSVALGVFALLRIVEVVLLICSFIPFVDVIAMPAFRTVSSNVEPKFFKFIDMAEKIAANLEAGVSAVVPWAAFGDAKATPTAADTIWPFALSLVPPRPSPRTRGHGDNSGPRPRVPRVGPAALPLEEDEFGTLCSKAFMIVPNQIKAVTDDIPVIGHELANAEETIFNDIARKVFGAGDGIFCQPIEGMLGKLLDLLADKACGFIDSRTQEREDDVTRAEQDDKDKNGGKSSSDNESSGSVADENHKQRKNGGGGSSCRDLMFDTLKLDDIADKSTFDVSSAKVWFPAANGSPLTHIWSWAQATPRMWTSDRQRIGIAARGQRPDAGEIKGSVAAAEFYYDCAAGWEHACEWDAMWAPGWTARMRRFRSPPRELADVGLSMLTVHLDDLERSLGEVAGEAVGEKMHEYTGLPAEGPISRLVTKFIDQWGWIRDINQMIKSDVQGARQKSGLNDLLNPRNYADPNRVH